MFELTYNFCLQRCPIFLLYFNETWTWSTDIRKILKYQISWKSVQREPSCSMRTDRHDEADRYFPQFCERALKPILLVGDSDTAIIEARMLQTATQICHISCVVFRCLPQTSQSTCHRRDASSPLRTHDSVTPSATCRRYATSCYDFSMQPVRVQFQYKLSVLWTFVTRTKQTCQPSCRRWVQPKPGDYFEHRMQFRKLKKLLHK